jgi:hypothetical protein
MLVLALADGYRKGEWISRGVRVKTGTFYVNCSLWLADALLTFLGSDWLRVEVKRHTIKDDVWWLLVVGLMIRLLSVMLEHLARYSIPSSRMESMLYQAER